MGSHSSFNCFARTTTITCPIWFKTLSFTYFHDYLQAYRALANSTDAAISSSASLFSLAKHYDSSFNYVIRTIATTSLFGSRLTLLLTFNRFTTALHSLRFPPILPATQSSLCFSVRCQASALRFRLQFHRFVRLRGPSLAQDPLLTTEFQLLYNCFAFASISNNSTGYTVFSLLLYSLPSFSFTIQSQLHQFRIITTSLISSRLSPYGWITTALHLRQFPSIPPIVQWLLLSTSALPLYL